MENENNAEPSAEQATQPEVKNVQFEKYKKPLKLSLIAQTVFSALVIVFVITMVFVPIFSINFESLSDEKLIYAETLPGVEEAMEKWIEKVLSSGKDSDFIMTFSLFDEAMLMFSSLGEAEFSSILFSSFSIIVLAVCAIIAVVVCIKNIAAILSPDDYVIGQYDEIKARGDSKRRSRSLTSMLASGLVLAIVYEIIAVVMGKTITGRSSAEEIVATSFMPYLTGVSVWIAVVALAAVLAIAAYCVGAYIKGKVKTQILREDYKIAAK